MGRHFLGTTDEEAADFGRHYLGTTTEEAAHVGRHYLGTTDENGGTSDDVAVKQEHPTNVANKNVLVKDRGGGFFVFSQARGKS